MLQYNITYIIGYFENKMTERRFSLLYAKENGYLLGHMERKESEI
jgi:hypothetical protein